MITGFIEPSSGEILIDGLSVLTHPIATKQKIGYLPESAPVYKNMTVYGFLKFCAKMRGIPKAQIKKEIATAIADCFLETVQNQKIETLSKGFRHRTSLAQTLLGNPDILILDEPTDGLDPNQKHQVRRLIHEWKKTRAVIISTHILEEVDAVCDRIVLINQGEIKFDGTPDEFRAISTNQSVVTLQCDGVTADQMIKALENQPFIDSLERISTHSIKLFGKDQDSIKQELNNFTRTQGWHILELTHEVGRLDDVFRTLTLGGLQ
jgi:ABC-2 type transport system ATP-binding protein